VCIPFREVTPHLNLSDTHVVDEYRVLTTTGRKPPLRTDTFLGFRGELLRQSPDAEVKVRRIRLPRTFRPANTLYNARNAFKTAQSAWSSSDCAIFRLGGIVGDQYSVRVSSSDHSKKAIARRIGLLNGGFRPVVVSTRLSAVVYDLSAIVYCI
jgi:hypothetical protein